MHIESSHFRFDYAPIGAMAALVAEVPRGIKSKQALLHELHRRLKFPDYFGFNWDALLDCIRDLSWLPPGQVFLVHRDIPLEDDILNQKTYLTILKNCVEKRGEIAGGMQFRDLVVVFPPETKEEITALLGSGDDSRPTRQINTPSPANLNKKNDKEHK